MLRWKHQNCPDFPYLMREEMEWFYIHILYITHIPGESRNTLLLNFLLRARAIIEAGSLGSAIDPILLVGRRGVPPGDRAVFTVRNFTLPIPWSISDMSGRPGVEAGTSARRGLV